MHDRGRRPGKHASLDYIQKCQPLLELYLDWFIVYNVTR